MIETTIATTITTDAGDTLKDLPPVTAIPDDAAEFERAMEIGGELPPMPVEPVKPPPESPATIGGKILDGLDQIRGAYKESMGEIGSVLDADRGQMRVGDLMMIQMQMTHVMFQEDLLGKVIGRTTQNVDELLKGQ